MQFLLFPVLGLVLGLAPFFSAAFAAENSLREPAFQENFYGVKIRGSRSWIVGYYGTILYSNDKGETWEIQQSKTKRALFRADFVSDEKGWISGSSGTILHTQDSGRNWASLPSRTQEHLFGIDFISEREGWAVGSRGTVLRTSDGGRSWLNRSIGEDAILSSVAFVPPDRGWIVGEFGVIYHTKNRGKSWIKQKSPIEVSMVSGESRNLFALLFPNPREGWAFGLDGTILKTQNGESWDLAGKNPAASAGVTRHHLFGAARFDGRIWAVGERGTVIASRTGMGDWEKVPVPSPPASLNSIEFAPDGFGLIVGNRGLILRTLDRGGSWHRLKIVPQGAGKGIGRIS